MKFGPVPTARASGAILAHSIIAAGTRLRKGQVLAPADVERLIAAGVVNVTIARLGPDDLAEDRAAIEIAKGLAGFEVSKGFAGRVNIYATAAGLVGVDLESVIAVNSISSDITLATVGDLHRVQAGALVATIKIISYGVDKGLVAQARRVMAAALRLHPVTIATASLVLTRTPDMKPSLLAKAESAVRARLARFGVDLDGVETVPHEAEQVSAAIARTTGEIVLLLTASATSDRNDIGPSGLIAAGGSLTRFGMPVDPGNLLFLGRIGGRHVVGLPGCARSVALNGADLVLGRLLCGLEISPQDFAAMGVGGLFKEIPSRPQPRLAVPPVAKPKVVVLMLAAGASRRMAGRDKLLKTIDGTPMLRYAVNAALGSRADRVRVVLPPEHAARRAVLDGLDVDLHGAGDWREGMGGSLRNGMAGLSGDFDAVIVALADMPDISAAHFDALIAAYDPENGHEICRATDENGRPGQPVLFGRRFFENLAQVTGDKGGRDVLRAAPEYIRNIAFSTNAAQTDLDTPQDWLDWRRNRP